MTAYNAYNAYKYIYPPRPEQKMSYTSLGTFEKMDKFLAQPKFNGSSLELYTNAKIFMTMNRHKEHMICKIPPIELLHLSKENGHRWMVTCGEYMNKNQNDETNTPWNHKYIIWDILVYGGNHLLGWTYDERLKLLRDIYPDNPVKKYLHQITENCFRVDSIYAGFEQAYNDIVPHNMYEGLVLKRKNAKLENGTSANNNTSSQIKIRKPTKNYNF